jgi:nucleoside-diphosphate-sugar epimerase
MAVKRIATALRTGDAFNVYGTGEQSRDVTYVDDAVLASIAVIDAAPTAPSTTSAAAPRRPCAR